MAELACEPRPLAPNVYRDDFHRYVVAVVVVGWINPNMGAHRSCVRNKGQSSPFDKQACSFCDLYHSLCQFGLFALISDRAEVGIILGLMPFLDNFAHIGGMIMGFLMGLCLLVQKRDDRLGYRLDPNCFQVRSRCLYLFLFLFLCVWVCFNSNEGALK